LRDLKNSELGFVNKYFHTTSREQTIHQDSATKNCLQRIFFHKFCLRRISVTKNPGCGAFGLLKRSYPLDFFSSVSYLVYQFIGIENKSNLILSDNNDTIFKKQQRRNRQITNLFSHQVRFEQKNRQKYPEMLSPTHY